MNDKFLYVANWKMYLSFNQEIDWIKNNFNELIQISNNENEIVICPSFLSIYSFNEILNNKNIKLGAQNCSSFDLGAYTGQISAESLAQLNCNYCIIGHSENRQYLNETNESIAKKAEILIKNKIVPIICIGETKQEYEQDKTKNIIENQLSPLMNIIKENNQNELIIAYEPIWSIGTGILPTIEHIDKICKYIKYFMSQANNKSKFRVLYGGSINGKTAVELKKGDHINGFLIGKASTDFQELKKIVL